MPILITGNDRIDGTHSASISAKGLWQVFSMIP
jgi:hypothetical protein